MEDPDRLAGGLTRQEAVDLVKKIEWQISNDEVTPYFMLNKTGDLISMAANFKNYPSEMILSLLSPDGWPGLLPLDLSEVPGEPSCETPSCTHNASCPTCIMLLDKVQRRTLEMLTSPYYGMDFLFRTPCGSQCQPPGGWHSYPWCTRLHHAGGAQNGQCECFKYKAVHTRACELALRMISAIERLDLIKLQEDMDNDHAYFLRLVERRERIDSERYCRCVHEVNHLPFCMGNSWFKSGSTPPVTPPRILSSRRLGDRPSASYTEPYPTRLFSDVDLAPAVTKICHLLEGVGVDDESASPSGNAPDYSDSDN